MSSVLAMRASIVAAISTLGLAGCAQSRNRAQPLLPASESTLTTNVAASVAAQPSAQRRGGAGAAFAVALADPSRAAPGARAASDLIAARIAACWQGGVATNAPAVGLRLALNSDGSVNAVEVADRDRFASDAGYRRAALAATRAFLQCGPFNLPMASYPDWSSLSLRITAHPA
jgi:hypothetical protein